LLHVVEVLVFDVVVHVVVDLILLVVLVLVLVVSVPQHTHTHTHTLQRRIGHHDQAHRPPRRVDAVVGGRAHGHVVVDFDRRRAQCAFAAWVGF
jgi:hypothetical protein